MSIVIDNLIHQTENEYLEFKSEWYCQNASSTSPKEWGEFLKDFAALVNCNAAYVEQKKYLIIGIDESEEELNKRVQDINVCTGKYKDLGIFKAEIIKKISQFFRVGNCDTKIYDDFTINYINISGKNILVFEINSAPEILILKKNLQDKKRTEKLNNVFIRKMKSTGDPEVLNASPEDIQKLSTALLSRNIKIKKDVNLEKSLDKTISLFVTNNAMFSLRKVTKKQIKKDLILFEVYSVTSSFTDIDFIYIFDKTNQIQTYKYLIENKIISVDSQKFILIDNGLNKDIKGIKSKFKAKEVLTLGDFALEYLYKDQLNEDIYHDGNFKRQRQIKNFIEPYTNGQTSKSALTTISEWYTEVSQPLMVVKGYGGVGKTTLVKFFLDNLYASYSKSNLASKILFIDSKKIIDEISRKGNIDDIFSFYEAYVKQQNISKVFDKELLELSVDNGSLLIVLDGIDEVIAKLGSKFNVSVFISSIYEHYLMGNEKTKIIITCRDYFWDIQTQNDFNIETIELLPFTEKLATKFFMKEFSEDSKELKKCLKHAQEFRLELNDKKVDGVHIYIPYILDVIMDMTRQKKEFGEVNKSDVESNLLNTNLTNDYFIGRICNREVEKLNNLDIDAQLAFFMNMAVDFNGKSHTGNMTHLFKGTGIRPSQDLLTLFKGHTLISYDNNSDTIYFKYDFFRNYFVNLFVSKFFTEKKDDDIDEVLEGILCEYIAYGNSFTSYVCERVFYNDELKLFIISLIESQISCLEVNDTENKRKLISSLLMFLLVALDKSSDKNDIEARTELLTDIFGPKLDYLSIVNVLDVKITPPTFDFKNKDITHSLFENYPYFWECKIDESTNFTHSTFNHLAPRDGVAIPQIHKNLFVDCFTSGIKDILDKKNNLNQEKQISLISNIKKIFNLFEQAGNFKEQKIEHIRKRSDPKVLEQLLGCKVIKPYKNPSKPNMKQYRVSEEYFDMIKILEQKGNSFELQKILRLLKI